MNITKDGFDKKGNIKQVKYDLPKFMKYTKEIKHTKNGKEIPYHEIKEKKEKIDNRINPSLICPMNWLQDILDNIEMSDNSNAIETDYFFIKMNGTANNRQVSKIKELAEKYDKFIKNTFTLELEDKDFFNTIEVETNNVIQEIKKIKIGNIVTINRLIETSLDLEKNRNKDIYITNNKYTRKILNLLYKSNKDKFLLNFAKSE